MRSFKIIFSSIYQGPSLVLIFILIAINTVAQPTMKKSAKNNKVVIGYVGGFRGLVNTDIIDVSKLTHINYAFVDVRNNRAWLHNEKTDSTNFRKLNLLKLQNPSLKILISIGGWAWSENFSDAVLTDTSRKVFAASAVDIMKKYNLDGVDIDWEYPGMPGEEGNIFRSEDKQNYTLMFRDIREQLNELESTTNKKYLLTTAVGGAQNFINNTEMDKAQQYLDFVNLMTYDYNYRTAGHHTNLYHSSNEIIENSAHKAVTAYIAAGVPPHKLVMGIAFYGKGGIVNDSSGQWFNKPLISTIRGGGYTFIKDSLVNQRGYKRHWDEKAKAPYLFDEINKAFITYDDEESVMHKCRYVTKHLLGGVMFWEYNDDPKGYLLNTITKEFNK